MMDPRSSQGVRVGMPPDPNDEGLQDPLTLRAERAAQALRAGEPEVAAAQTTPQHPPPFRPEPGQPFRFKGSPRVYNMDEAGTIRRAQGQAPRLGKAARKQLKRQRQDARRAAARAASAVGPDTRLCEE